MLLSFELQARGDVASLVRNFLGPIYGEGVLDLLTRQARDILVCAYHGNLDNFVKSYLSPAAGLLAEIKRFASQKVSLPSQNLITNLFFFVFFQFKNVKLLNTQLIVINNYSWLLRVIEIVSIGKVRCIL